MNSGEDKFSEQNYLPIQSGSSLLALSNHVGLMHDVLEKKNPEYWLHKALILLEKKWDTIKNLKGESLASEYKNPLYFAEALYNINRCLLVDPEFQDAYLLKGYVEIYLSKAEEGCNSIIESFCKNYVKGIVEGLFGLPDWVYDIESSQLLNQEDNIVLNRLTALRAEIHLTRLNSESICNGNIGLARIILLLNFIRKRARYKHEIERLLLKAMKLSEELAISADFELMKWLYLINGICASYLILINRAQEIDNDAPYKQLENALKLDSSFIPALFEKSILLLKQGNTIEANEIIAQILSNNFNRKKTLDFYETVMQRSAVR